MRKSIFTLEIPEWINKVRVGTVHYITPKEKLPSKHEESYAKKNRCQAILCGFKTQK
jgi:hypothetical protein